MISQQSPTFTYHFFSDGWKIFVTNIGNSSTEALWHDIKTFRFECKEMTLFVELSFKAAHYLLWRISYWRLFKSDIFSKLILVKKWKHLVSSFRQKQQLISSFADQKTQTKYVKLAIIIVLIAISNFLYFDFCQREKSNELSTKTPNSAVASIAKNGTFIGCHRVISSSWDIVYRFALNNIYSRVTCNNTCSNYM